MPVNRDDPIGTDCDEGRSSIVCRRDSNTSRSWPRARAKITGTEENALLANQHLERLGPYRITGKLGEGGMGVVYAAHDERLDRGVALKVIRTATTDWRARERLQREARAAASLNHPNVCHLYDIGEENGELFLAMELLDGESLAIKLARGPLPCVQAIQIALSVLAAIEAVHRRGLVHRDLKPSNVFLTSQGVKVLDFGLARSIPTDSGATETALTVDGAVVGTPTYMAPEQVLGHTVDGRTDLFAVACVLYEMLCGTTPFAGESFVQVLHAITSKQPPVLGGSPAVAAVDRVIHRALSKDPQHRYQTADAMAQDLRAALLLSDAGVGTTARPMTRLIVLPFRMLRADAESDFLAFSLPDAITSSLTGLQTLIVRSSVVASRFAGDVLDLKAVCRSCRRGHRVDRHVAAPGRAAPREYAACRSAWRRTHMVPQYAGVARRLVRGPRSPRLSHRPVALVAIDDA